MKRIIEKERKLKEKREQNYELSLRRAWNFWLPRYEILENLFRELWAEFQLLEDGTDWIAEETEYADRKKYMGVNGYGFEFNITIKEHPFDRKYAWNERKKIFLVYNSGCSGIGDGRDIGNDSPFDLPEDIMDAPKPDGVFYMVEKMKDESQGGDTIYLYLRDEEKEVKSFTYKLSPRLSIEKIKKDFWSLLK